MILIARLKSGFSCTSLHKQCNAAGARGVSSNASNLISPFLSEKEEREDRTGYFSFTHFEKVFVNAHESIFPFSLSTNQLRNFNLFLRVRESSNTITSAPNPVSIISKGRRGRRDKVGTHGMISTKTARREIIAIILISRSTKIGRSPPLFAAEEEENFGPVSDNKRFNRLS